MYSECTLSVTPPLDEGNYKVCLTSPSTGIVLVVNDSAVNSQGYRCTSSSCSKIPLTDYALQAKSSNFETTLEESLDYFESNTNPGSYLKDAIANYLQTCNYQDDYCIIPINVSSKNNANIKIHDLSYVETLQDGQTYNRDKFLLGVKSEGVQTLYKTTTQKIISLSRFNLLTPSKLGNYILTLQLGIKTATAAIAVVEAPNARFNASTLVPVNQPVTFDASFSSGKTNLTYNWDFGDNRVSFGEITTHSYFTIGNYLVTLTVTDENNIEDKITLSLEVYSESATAELINNTMSRLQSLQTTYANSNLDIKDVYLGLGLESEIQNALIELQTASTLSESKVNEILNRFPTSINIINTIKISPYLSQTQINELYGFESVSYRETLQEVNTRFQREVTVRHISLTYPISQKSLLLIKKTITTPEPLSDVNILEIIPNSLAPSQASLDFLGSLPQTTRLQGYQSASYSLPNLQDEFTFYYTIDSTNLEAAKNTILIVVPQELSPALTPFNCGNNICNPAEDSISCPEDCSCGNNQCEPGESEYNCPADCKQFPWFSTIIVPLIILALALVVWKTKFYKKLKLDDLISALSSNFNKSPFKSGMELSKVRSYVKSALEKGYGQAKIEDALLSQGWTRRQVDYAFKKLSKKKQKS